MAMNRFESEAVSELNQNALKNRAQVLHLSNNIQRGLDELKYLQEHILKSFSKDALPLDARTLSQYTDRIKEKLTEYYPE
jgi:hypothetical protein